MMYILYKVHGVHYEYVGMSFVFSRSTKKILGMQHQARRAVFIAVRLFDTDKKETKLNRARIFTESQVCFSKCPITSIQVCAESQKLSEFSHITLGSLKRGCHTF